MSSWRKQPPTIQEWMDMENHGMWWVKFKLGEAEEDVDEDGTPIFWPEVWYTDCVQICSQGWPGDPDERLIATGFIIKELHLDDTEQTKDLYWQPVAPPQDDVKDKEPVV